MTTFLLTDSVPCMDIDAQISNSFYPTEVSQYDECPDERVKTPSDYRFRNAASFGIFEFGEWDIMKENGVAEIL